MHGIHKKFIDFVQNLPFQLLSQKQINENNEMFIHVFSKEDFYFFFEKSHGFYYKLCEWIVKNQSIQKML